MSVIKVSIYRCVARDAADQVVYRVYVVANGPTYASRTANAWIKQEDKGWATVSPLDCHKTTTLHDDVPILLDWKD